MVEREGPLSLRRQCQLLGLNRGAVYYEPVEIGAYELELMSLIDRQYLRTPFYGSRRITAWLQSQGHAVNRKRVQRLMQRMGLEVIYQRPRTSRPAPGHRIYPYLLRGLCIERVHQVWAADITYIPMAQGFLYLVAVMDWVSRYVLAWRLSNLLEPSFCIEALEEALGKGRPEIFNTDQGSQFTTMASLRCWALTASPSAWTAAAALPTISSWNVCGAVSNTRKSISRPMRAWRRPAAGSAPTSNSTTINGCTRHSVTALRSNCYREWDTEQNPPPPHEFFKGSGNLLRGLQNRPDGSPCG